MDKFSSYFQKAIVLGTIYLLLTSNFQLSNLVMAILIGLGISALVPEHSLFIAWRRLPGALLAIILYIGVLFMDMLKSGIQVGRILLNPKLPIKPGIITIDAGCQSELSTALSAHAISLTPGELVVAMDDQGHLLTHCLDVSNSIEYGESARQLRQAILIKIFE